MIEPIAARGWPAAHTDRLGGWRPARFRRPERRINTCWALEPPDRDAEAAIEAAEAWYAARGLAPRFKIIEADPQALDLVARLRRRGYSSIPPP
ncbi:MAG: hypothetical protein WDM85_04100 [Caulobacteraceae bacterium]